MNKNQRTGRGVGLYIVIFVVLLVTIALLSNPNGQAAPAKLSYTDVREDIKSGSVTDLVIGSSTVQITKSDGTKYTYEVTDMDYFMSDLGESITAQQDAGTLKVDYLVERTDEQHPYPPCRKK